MPKALFNTIKNDPADKPYKEPLGFKEVLAEVNRMAQPIVPITNISFM